MKTIQPDLPTWLHAYVLVNHRPSRILFCAAHCQRERATGRIWLWDAKSPDSTKYPLDECEPAKLEHFTGSVLLVIDSKPLTVVKVPDGFLVSDGRRSLKVLLNPSEPVEAAAQSLAKFFNGVIVPDPEEVEL
jgi:hypothetical protein